MQVEMKAGVGYAVVVDGFNGQFGPYQVDISAVQVQACTPGLRPNFQFSGCDIILSRLFLY